MSAAAGAFGVYLLVRWLIKAAEQPQPAPHLEMGKLPIITPPPRRPSPPLAAAFIAADFIAAASSRRPFAAERAVVRDLRLGVGAHLALRSLNPLREVIEALESRYQVSVSVGQSHREIADRMLHGGHPQSPKLPLVPDQHPWRVI